MKTILAFVLTAIAFISAARADVFIYRGVDNLTVDAATAAQIKSLNIYLIVDYDGAQTGMILFGKIQGAKRFQALTATTSSFSSVTFPKGKIESLIATGSASNTSASNFSYSLTLFRGANANLLIGTSPSHTTDSRPNLLKGTIITAASGPSYFEQHSGLTFQGAATIKANNATQTINQVVATLAAGLMAKGYVSL